jgi:hypothetical protein
VLVLRRRTYGQAVGSFACARDWATIGTRKSFLVLFFKKEQMKSRSFLKKRSKKLFSVWLGLFGNCRVEGGQARGGLVGGIITRV